MKEKYTKVCSEKDCFRLVKECDIERTLNGEIYERSKKCFYCRTKQDKEAIKRFHKKVENNLIKVNK